MNLKLNSVFNGEVYFILFLLSGFYKASFSFVDLTLVFFALSVLCAVSRIYKNPVVYKELFKPMYAYGIICLLMIASLIYSGGNAYAFDKTISFVVITGWSFVGVFLLTNRENPYISLKRYIGAFFVVGLVMIGNSLLVDDNTKFSTAFGSNYLALGKMAAITSLLTISYVFFLKPKRIKKIAALVLFAVSTYTLINTGGRMPVLSFVVCLIALLALGIRITGFDFQNIKMKKRTIVYSFVGFLSIPLLIKFLSSKGNLFLSRFLLLFNGGGDSALGRAEHYNTSFSALLDSYMLGVGSGGYLAYTGSLSTRAYPHNVLLETVAELGVIGLVSLLSLLLIGLLRYFKHFFYRDNFYSVVLLLMFIYSMLNALTSGDLNDNRLVFFFIALLCLSKVFKKHDEQSNSIEA